MFSRFFIDRPIFATVLSLLITLAGGIAVLGMPLSLYPPISPPVVSVDCNYPGASADVVSEAVATPIEQQVNGVEGMLYMSSQCTNDGGYNLTVTFKNNVDLDMAQVLVQNRVNLALPSLPDVVKQTGVTTRKRSPDILLVIQLISPNERYDQTYLSNYAVIQVRDEVARIPGVSECFVFGQRDYSMRVWVDPEKVAYRGITAGEVLRAIREQNIPVASGGMGRSPVESGQENRVSVPSDRPTEQGRGVREDRRQDHEGRADGQASRRRQGRAWPEGAERQQSAQGRVQSRDRETRLSTSTACPASASPSFSFPTPTRSTWPTVSWRR